METVVARDSNRGNPIGAAPVGAGPTAAVACLMAAFAAGPLAAQGFGFYEHGSCTMGRAGAGVASPCDDGSAIFFNPAGLAGTDGVTVSGGGTLVLIGGGFTDDRTLSETDLDQDPLFAPHLYATYGFSDRLAAGIGVYAPYGLGTEWPEDFDGAFVGYDNDLQSIYVQPTVSYEVADGISIGAGPALAVGSVELNQRLDLSQQEIPPEFGAPEGTTFGQLGVPFRTAFADANLEATGATGVAGHLGVEIDVSDRLSFGARYLSSVELDYDGDATFTQVETGLVAPAPSPFSEDMDVPLDGLLQGQFQGDGLLVDQKVSTSIEMPAQLAAGLAWRATPRLTLLADYQWVGWSSFDRVELDFERLPTNVRVEEYDDTHGIRLGADLSLEDGWNFRAGFLRHGAAAPDQTVTPLLPEGVRNEITAGLGWTVSPGFDVDVAYQHIAQDDRRGRVQEPAEGVDPTVELNSGLYTFTGHLIGTTVTIRF